MHTSYVNVMIVNQSYIKGIQIFYYFVISAAISSKYVKQKSTSS